MRGRMILRIAQCSPQLSQNRLEEYEHGNRHQENRHQFMKLLRTLLVHEIVNGAKKHEAEGSPHAGRHGEIPSVPALECYRLACRQNLPQLSREIDSEGKYQKQPQALKGRVPAE